jgi:hypothetical protein
MSINDEFSQKIVWTKDETLAKSSTWRNGYKWSVNECLRLEREFDLLELSVPEIALLHNRTVNAIMFKLEAEGLDTYNNLYIKTYGEDFLDQEINNFITQQNNKNEENDEFEYVPNLDQSDDDSDIVDVANTPDETYKQNFMLHQLKSIQTHINNMLGFFTSTNKKDTVNEISSSI